MSENTLEISILIFLVVATFLLLLVAIIDTVLLKKRNYKAELLFRKNLNIEKIEKLEKLEKEHKEISKKVDALVLAYDLLRNSSVTDISKINISKEVKTTNKVTEHSKELQNKQPIVFINGQEDIKLQEQESMKEIQKQLSILMKNLKEDQKNIPISEIKGVGPKTEFYFHNQNIFYVKDLLELSESKQNLDFIIANLPGLKSEQLAAKIKKFNIMLTEAREFLTEKK